MRTAHESKIPVEGDKLNLTHSQSPAVYFETKQKKNHQDKTPMGATTRQGARIMKGYDMTSKVSFTTPNTGVCASRDGTKLYAFVLPDFCECPDNQIRGNICKHLIAARAKISEDTKVPSDTFEQDLVRKELVL